MLVNNLGKVPPGTRVRCVRWQGTSFKTGATYTVIGGDPHYPDGYMLAAGNIVEEAIYAGQWEIVQPDANAVTLTFGGVDSGRKVTYHDVDNAEARLMALWKAVPPGCCPNCGPNVPLPCSYHPKRDKVAEFAKAYQDPDDIEF